MGLRSSTPRRLGVFGGTFDPIHNGHLAVARFALEHGGLENVLLVPAGQPWLRDGPPVASAENRLRMTELAVASETGLEVSDVDVAREGTTYTADTLADLRHQYGGEVEFVLVLGSDSALQMDRWERAGELRDLCTVLVIGRPGERWPDDLPETHPAHDAKYLEGPMVDISATELREQLSAAADVSDSVPEPVLEHIKKHRLYQG